MDKNDFKCVMCHKTFTSIISDEEALKESKEMWGANKRKDLVAVCDSCFQKIKPEKDIEFARKCGYKK